MRVDRLGQLFEQKYGLRLWAAEFPPRKPIFPLPAVTFHTPEMKDIDAKIRNYLDELWRYANKDYNILKECAQAGAAKPKNDVEASAVAGFKFCEKVLSIIDYLKANRDTVPLSEVRESLTQLINLINDNRGTGADIGVQFMHVSDLIMFMINRRKIHDREKEISIQRQKARTGLSKIVDVSVKIINYMNELGGVSPVGGRFVPAPTEILKSEKEWFFLNYGEQFGIPNIAAWNVVIDMDPDLSPFLARLVRILRRPSRGAALHNAPKIKSFMHNLLLKYQQSKATNVPYLERGQSTPIDPSLLGESGESPSVLEPEQLQSQIQRRDVEQQKKLEELKQKQIEEDRERHIRSEGTSFLLDQLLKGTL